MQIATTHFLPLTLIRRQRLLPGSGRVLVHPGQKVSARDIVAEGYLRGAHVLLDVRRALKLESVEEAEKLIERQVGETLQKEDILAQTKGMFPQTLRSPVAGVIQSIQSGKVLIEARGEAFTLQAGFSGIVVEVTGSGATIETTGALAQGVWGNDCSDQGLLVVAAQKPGDEMTKQRLDVSMRGAVVMGGACNSADVLQIGAELPLRGLVLSSLSADLIPIASSMAYPIVVMEGFGYLPFNQAAFDLLSTHERRDVCLKAHAWNSITGERPEVIIPLPANAELAPALTEFRPGKQVRILGLPAASPVGTIIAILPGMTRLPNGIAVSCAEVVVKDATLQVPLVNLDVLE